MIAWLQVTSGQGPEECAWVVQHVVSRILREATAQEDRSQHLNRKLAWTRLLDKLSNQTEQARKEQKQNQWTRHAELQRGNPVRVYEGTPFKRMGN